MSERNNFEDMYCFRVTTGSLIGAIVPADTSAFNDPSHQADAFVSGDNGVTGDTNMGVTTGVYGLPLTNHPNMDFGQSQIVQRKALGQSYQDAQVGREFLLSTRFPVTTWEFDVTYKNIAPFLWALFQNGAVDGGSATYVKVFSPYSAGNVTEVHLALCRVMSTQVGSNNSHLFGGCIVDSITFTGEEGQPLKASVSLIGYNGVSDFDFGGSANICSYDTTAPLMFQDASFSVAGTAVNIPSFNITITNNARPAFYDSKHPVKYIYGDINATGSFQLPWGQATVGGNVELNKYIAGTSSEFKAMWGSGSDPVATAADFMITAESRYMGMPVGGDDETILDCSITGAYSTNKAVEVSVVDSLDRGIT